MAWMVKISLQFGFETQKRRHQKFKIGIAVDPKQDYVSNVPPQNI